MEKTWDKRNVLFSHIVNYCVWSMVQEIVLLPFIMFHSIFLPPASFFAAVSKAMSSAEIDWIVICRERVKSVTK